MTCEDIRKFSRPAALHAFQRVLATGKHPLIDHSELFALSPAEDAFCVFHADGHLSIGLPLVKAAKEIRGCAGIQERKS